MIILIILIILIQFCWNCQQNQCFCHSGFRWPPQHSQESPNLACGCSEHHPSSRGCASNRLNHGLESPSKRPRQHPTWSLFGKSHKGMETALTTDLIATWENPWWVDANQESWKFFNVHFCNRCLGLQAETGRVPESQDSQNTIYVDSFINHCSHELESPSREAAPAANSIVVWKNLYGEAA